MSEALAPSLKLCVMTTESMRPAVEPGDFLMIEASGPGRFEIGDLALLPAASESAPRIVHRVVAIRRAGKERLLVTKGDAVLDADAPILEGVAAGRAVLLGRPNQAWIRLDRAPARWSGRAAAAAFAWVAAGANSPRRQRLERGILAVVGVGWAEPALRSLYASTLKRRWAWARGLRRGLLHLSLDGERRVRTGPILVRRCVNGLGCRAAVWGLGAASSAANV